MKKAVLKTTRLIITTMTLTAVQAQNQTFYGQKAWGGFGNEYLVEITTDQAGNVYNTGHFEGTADFDPALGTFELTSPANNWDIFISMLDKNGNFIGARRMGGTSGDYGKSITTDTKGTFTPLAISVAQRTSIQTFLVLSILLLWEAAMCLFQNFDLVLQAMQGATVSCQT